MLTLPARITLAAAALALLPLATACTSDGGGDGPATTLTCGQWVGGPVTIAVGVRANSSKPTLPAAVNDLMKAAAKNGSTVRLLRVDGAPSVVLTGTFKSNAGNDVARQHDLDLFMQTATTTLGGITAKQAEVDDLLAINEMARLTPAGGTIVLIDSGLQTTGQIRFQDPGTLGGDPNEMVTYLQKLKQLPDLSGRVVLFAGLGNTAAPQPQITNPDLRRQLTAFWRTVAEKSNAACVQVIETAEVRTEVASSVPVTIVPMPETPKYNGCGTTVLADDTVGFVPDQATFRDPAEARRILSDLAGIVTKGHQRVTLTGTTSSAGDSEPGRVELSLERAQAVKAVLVSLGVDAAAITTVGAGSHGPNHVNDRASDGALIPTLAARNRSVIVQLSCPTSG